MKAIVLAGGKGSRLSSNGDNTAKVLRKVNKKPIIDYVLNNLSFIKNKSDITIVVGYKKEDVIEHCKEYSIAVQEKQLGTGDAVKAAVKGMPDYSGNVLVCYGDMPLYLSQTFMEMYSTHITNKNDCTVLDGITKEKFAYGRIITDKNGAFVKIVEEKDCNDSEKNIEHLNVGVYIFNFIYLKKALLLLNNDNAQHEYYLTDIPQIISSIGGKIGIHSFTDSDQMLGINTPEELKTAEELLNKRGQL